MHVRANFAFIVAFVVAFVIAVASLRSVPAGGQLSVRSPDCLKFARYIPSKWESQWLQGSLKRDLAICDLINKQRSESQVWLDGVSHPDQLSFLPTRPPDQMDPVWSLYMYHDTCAAQSKVIYVPIEPAAGLLRNPLAAPCNVSDQAPDVQDRDYLYLAPPAFTNNYPGRKLLFDLGTGASFSSSLSWFLEGYGQQGITFDEIWCWEAVETGAHEYWRSVPDDYVSKLHFYNTYASDDTGPAAPLGILQKTFQKGDFVVIKLDIDNEELENNIMQKLKDVRHMVGELFFEKHFDAAEMRPYFGTLKTTYAETLQLFHEYRKVGVRMHYWP